MSQPGYVDVGGQRIDAAVTLWAAGVQASPLGKLLGVPTDKRGCVFVNRTLNPEGHPGNLRLRRPCPLRAERPSGPRRCPARHADGRSRRPHDRRRPRTTSRASRFIILTRATWPPSAASPRSPKSSGPSKPTGVAFPRGSPGSPSTFIFLIGFRNRLAVLSQWIWSYFTFTYGVRLIYGSQALPGWTDRSGAEIHPAGLQPASQSAQSQTPSKPAAAD